jgi:hypothetical protein
VSATSPEKSSDWFFHIFNIGFVEKSMTFDKQPYLTDKHQS